MPTAITFPYGLCSKCADLTELLQGRIHKAKGQAHALKERFLEEIRKAASVFHGKGITALSKTVDFLGIKKGMETLCVRLEQSILVADRGVDRLGRIADEMYGAAAHIGNMGRELAGKEPKQIIARDVEKGAVFQIQKGLYHAMGVMKGIKEKTEAALQKAEGMAGKDGKPEKPSVRESLKSLKEEAEGRSRAKLTKGANQKENPAR